MYICSVLSRVASVIKKIKKNSDIWLLVALKPKEFRYIGSVTEPLYTDFITPCYLEYDTKQKEEEHACRFFKKKGIKKGKYCKKTIALGCKTD